MKAAAATGSAWRSDTRTRPLRAWTQVVLAQLASCLDDAVRAWAMDWGVPGGSLEPARCEALARDFPLGGRWKVLGHTGDDAAWLQWNDHAWARVVLASFGVDESTTPVVAAVLAECRDDAMQRLAAALRLSAGQADATPRSAPANAAAWDGTLVAILPWGCRLILEAGVVKAALHDPGPAQSPAPSGALVRVSDALAAHPTRLRVQLAPCELALAELQGLRPGDVLRLTHLVAAPVRVGDSTGEVLFDGWLARRGGRKAVELVVRDTH